MAYEVMPGNTADKTTLKGRLSKLEAQLLALPWQKVRAGVDVKLLRPEGELYVLG